MSDEPKITHHYDGDGNYAGRTTYTAPSGYKSTLEKEEGCLTLFLVLPWILRWLLFHIR